MMTRRPMIWLGNFVSAALLAASSFAQNTPPPPTPNTLPPDEVNRLTLSLEEIRRASSSTKEQERREQMLRLYEEAQRRKAALQKEKGDEPKADSLTKFNLKEFADENQKEIGALATTYEEKKAHRIELMMRRSFNPESYTSGSSQKNAKPTERAPTVISSAPTPSSESAPDTTLRDYTSATTRKLQESGGTNSVLRPLSPTLSVSNRSFSIFNRAPKSEEPARGTTPSVTTGFRPALTTGPATPGKGSAASTATGTTQGTPESSSQTVPTSPLDVVKSSTTIEGPLDIVRSSFTDTRYGNPMTPYDPAATTAPTDGKRRDDKNAKPGTTATSETPKPTSPYASYLQTPSLFGSPTLRVGQQPAATAPAPGSRPALGGTDQSVAGNKQNLPGSDQPNAGNLTSANTLPSQSGLASLLTPTPMGSPTASPSQGGALTPSSASAPLTPGGLSFPNAGMYGPQPIGSFQPIAPIPTPPRKGGLGPNGYYDTKSITDLQYGR